MEKELIKPEKHVLLDEQFDLVFDHEKYGRVELSAGINPLSDKWMWWWKSKVDNSMNAGNKFDVSGIVKGIRGRAGVKILIDTF